MIPTQTLNAQKYLHSPVVDRLETSEVCPRCIQHSALLSKLKLCIFTSYLNRKNFLKKLHLTKIGLELLRTNDISNQVDVCLFQAIERREDCSDLVYPLETSSINVFM